MVELLGRHSFARADAAEDADLILLNTCAVREKAEHKLLSALGRYREVKARARRAHRACPAASRSRRRTGSSKRVPYVDFVFGPDNIAQAAGDGRARRASASAFAETGWVDSEEYVFPRADPETARGRPPRSSPR